MENTGDIKYIVVNDHLIDFFEGQFLVDNGITYNSYIIFDQKIAVIDTVDVRFQKKWLKTLCKALHDKKPDYLIIQHMEPDHSGSIMSFLEEYPDTTIVGNEKTFLMIQQFYNIETDFSKLIIQNNETLSLGKHQLKFIFAPMVHWPEVMVTFDCTEKVLFSADAFGKFGTRNDVKNWLNEARRYYFGIVGKYGKPVQALLKTLANYDIQTICPLHGPVLSENPTYYIDKYDIWSSYQPEENGVLIAYASVYGNTQNAAEYLAQELNNNGITNVVLMDLVRDDLYECVAQAFRYDKIILASITYNSDIFPCMKQFLNLLIERNFQNRKIGFIENGSWAPVAIKSMKSMLANCKDLTYFENTVSIKSAMNADTRREVRLLAEEIQ